MRILLPGQTESNGFDSLQLLPCRQDRIIGEVDGRNKLKLMPVLRLAAAKAARAGWIVLDRHNGIAEKPLVVVDKARVVVAIRQTIA